MTRVTLRRGRAKPLWFGHPWIYSEAIAQTEGEATPGAEVAVHDHEGRFVGRGLLSPQSQIRVRLCTRRDEPLDAAFFARRVASAAALRRRLGLPDAATDAFRLINSEGDGLPGLTVDAYGDALVVQFGTIGMWTRQAGLLDALEAEVHPRTIYAAAASSFAAIEGFAAAPQVLRGEERDQVTCREHGVVQEVEPLKAQKTGLFLDQRENRDAASLYAAGRLLDCFSYHGGFALRLASRCPDATALDISEEAVARILENASRNRQPHVRARAVNVFDELRRLERSGERFDTIVLDPPAFAKNKAAVPRALAGYKEINLRALRLLSPGGHLVTCSCSYNVDEATFGEVVHEAAVDAQARVTVVEKRMQGRDHPVLLGVPETYYLKCFILRRVE